MWYDRPVVSTDLSCGDAQVTSITGRRRWVAEGKGAISFEFLRKNALRGGVCFFSLAWLLSGVVGFGPVYEANILKFADTGNTKQRMPLEPSSITLAFIFLRVPAAEYMANYTSFVILLLHI
jgi:hypothetical protein